MNPRNRDAKIYPMIKLIERPEISSNEKAARYYRQLNMLHKSLENREWTNEIKEFLNQSTNTMNQLSNEDKKFIRRVKIHEHLITEYIEKKTKIVPKAYYKKKWFTLGLGVFGMPIGIIIGNVTGNMGLLGIGLPFGLLIGQFVGSSMDKRAAREGRQLDFESVHK